MDAQDFADRMTPLVHEIGELLAEACRVSPHPPAVVLEAGLKIMTAQVRQVACIHLGIPLATPDGGN